ncbi:MAG: hypothetical protein WBD74_00825 [Candidatus Aquilonibacter sp.]
MKQTGLTIPNAGVVATRSTYSGEQTIDGIAYYVMIAPLASYNGTVIGAYWFAVPFAQFDAVVNHTLGQTVLWGALGLIFAPSSRRARPSRRFVRLSAVQTTSRASNTCVISRTGRSMT